MNQLHNPINLKNDPSSRKPYSPVLRDETLSALHMEHIQNLYHEKRTNYTVTLRLGVRNEELAQSLGTELTSLLPEINLKIVNQVIDNGNNKSPSPEGFVVDLFSMLMKDQADAVVLPADELPYPIPVGFEVVALTKATDPGDVLVSRNKRKLKELPSKPRIVVSSSVQEAFIKELRPDAELKTVTGTVKQKIQLLEQGEVDAFVTMACDLMLLGLQSEIAETLPFRSHPLQGHLAVVARSGNRGPQALFATADIRKSYGKVYLTGFGPGDPELLTIKAHRALENADVIYFDDLIEKSYLENFRGRKVFVGKRKGNHSHAQEAINEMLYQSVISGKNTVRLKGGDPFIFGRGGEEFEYLHRRLVVPEVIPGITAAVGAAAQIAVPLTNRGESSSVAFITTLSQKEIVVPQVDTLVYYMGASNLKEVRERVLAKGVDPSTPAAIITDATQTYARTLFTTLAELPDEAQSPSIIMISKTIKNRNTMSAPPNVLVTGLSAEQYQHLGNIIHQPLIEIVPIEMPDEFFRFIRFVENYRYIVFTNRNSVNYFMEWVRAIGSDAGLLAKNIIVSIGTVTTAELHKHGIIPHLQPDLDSSESIIELFKSKGITNEEILIPRSDIAPNFLPDGLRALGNNVHVITVYYTQPVKKIEKVDLSNIDILVFTSPSGVKNFLKHYGEVPLHIKVITRGEQTKEAYERNSALYI